MTTAEVSTALSAYVSSAPAEDAATRRPRMANREDIRPGLTLTSQALSRDGRPWIPVSGEMHYSRVPRERWAARLRQMVAGGITVVATYVPWIHHMQDREKASFEGNLDIAAFVDLARAEGLDVVLRIGPWVHAEIRNGGFPDWVQNASVAHRTDDPGYLDLVRGWWRQLAAALDGRCEPNTVLGIQLENELYDQPGHLVTLKALARECGMTAPLWTATAWGGAQLPAHEVFPLYGGYADGFWVDPGSPWEPTFRDHFFFSDVWDDPGIGADVRSGNAGPDRLPISEWFPPATCELGGGMATAYHRRPTPSGRDVTTVGHCKIGNGSAWQGYFMYVGGTNPARDLQESHATGYPNDMPQLGYDFHAPVGESGRLGDGHAELRVQNSFLASFGSLLGDAPSHLPDLRPVGVDDAETLRWAYRGTSGGGFLFIAWHQPHVPLSTFRGASFRLRFDHGDLSFPSKPVDIPTGTLARWPVRLPIGSARIEWLTASAVTLIDGAVPTLVALSDQGVPVEVAFDGAEGKRVVHAMDPSRVPTRIITAGGEVDILVLPSGDAARVWAPVDAEGRTRRLLLSEDEVRWSRDGVLEVFTLEAEPTVLAYDPAERGFLPVPMSHTEGLAHEADVAVEQERPASAARPRSYGMYEGRPSAPDDGIVADFSAVYRLVIPEAADDADACLEISWAGDVADLRVDGQIVADRFWDGSIWRINCRDAGIYKGREVLLHILPLACESIVHVPAKAQIRRDQTEGDLMVLDGVRMTRRSVWRGELDRG